MVLLFDGGVIDVCVEEYLVGARVVVLHVVFTVVFSVVDVDSFQRFVVENQLEFGAFVGFAVWLVGLPPEFRGLADDDRIRLLAIIVVC